MADDKKPKKKKKPSDTAAAGTGGIPVAPQRTPVDAEGDDYEDLLFAEAPAGEGAQVEPTEPPERGFWQTVLFGGQSDKGFIEGSIEEIRSAARGVVGGIAEGISALKPAGRDHVAVRSDVDPSTVDTSPRKPIVDVKEVGGTIKSARDQVLGKRSDDALAGFVESASQFATGFIASRGLGATRGALVGRAAVADMYAFDPYEASLSELAARAPKWSGLHELGTLLSVDKDDHEIVARLKRGAEGWLGGKIVDGLIAAARSIRAARQARAAKDPAEKAALEQTADQEAAKAQAYHEGNLGTADEVVEARPAADGDGWELVSRPQPRTLPEALEELRVAKEALAKDDLTGLSSAQSFRDALPRAEADPNTLIVTFDANNFGQVNKRIGWDAGSEALKDVAAAIRQAAEEAGLSTRAVFRNGGDEFTVFAPKDVADKVRARAEEIYGSRMYGETEVSLSGTMGNTFKDADGQLQAAKAVRKGGPAPVASTSSGPTLKVADEAEAKVLAAEMNAGVRERALAAKGMDDASARAGFAKFKELVENNDIDGIKALMEESDHFNVSYMAGEKESLAAIETMSRMFKDTIDAAQARGQSVEELIETARRGLGLLTESQAHKVVVGGLDRQVGQSVHNLMSDMYLKWRGQKLAGLAARLDARPNDAVLLEEFREGYLKLLETQKALAAANSEWGRTGRMMQERANPLVDGAAPRPDGSPRPQDAPGSTQKPKGTTDTPPMQKGVAEAGWMGDLPAYVAGMKTRELRSVAQMVRMADGQPRNLFEVAHAARVIMETGFGKKAMEVFINFILSGAKTTLTAMTSGATLLALEPSSRMLAGALSGNRALRQEGADMMYANLHYLWDNVKSMGLSLKMGRSLINPQPKHIAIGGYTGEAIRLLGRPLIAGDEFIRVTAYRSYVRAKSLRLGRADGLTGPALEARVQRDLEAAFDKETGMATLSEPLQYAEHAAMTTPLGKDTAGGAFHDYVSNRLEAKFIAPFVKVSVNLWRTGVTTTPGLNLIYKKNREIMAKGGEEAAILHARSAIAGSLYGYMTYQAVQGNVTGRGPTDPALRKLWLRDNQPYSIRVGDQWISYRRGDPLGMPIGMIADLNTMLEEMGTEEVAVEEFAVGIVAALTSNLSSKTYTQGLTNFAEAWGEGNVPSARRWLSNMVTGFTVPAAVAQLSDDEIMREVESIGDAIINRIPGWSKSLDPKHNLFGEPVMKAAGLMNRNVNPFTMREAGKSVESDLLLLERGFSSPSRQEKIGGVKVDYGDKKWDTKGTGKSPYVRWMELVREPRYGKPLREQMENLVRSDAWKHATDGTEDSPGGKRWDMASGLKERAYASARRQMMAEYPELAREISRLKRRAGAARQGGEAAESQVDNVYDRIRSIGN